MQLSASDRGNGLAPRNTILVLSIICLIAEITALVHLMDGTDGAFPHLMYIPIVLSAYYFSTNATIISSAVCGLALGPWTLKNDTLSLAQMPMSWILRMVIFIVIGITCSLLFQRVDQYRKAETERSYINFLTGQPNLNKLRVDLAELISQQQSFSLIAFRVRNINSIMQSISYDVALSALKMALNELKTVSGGRVYSFYSNEFALVLPGISVEAAREIGNRFLDMTLEPFPVDMIHIGLLISGGLVNCPLNADHPDELIKKMGIALNQAAEETGLYIYDDLMEQKSKSQSDMVPLLLNAIKNKELYLVYQPKMSLKGDRQKGAEALLRWNNSKLGHIPPAHFIKTAEEIGFIGEITKWVIRNVIDQSRAWLQMGMTIKIAVNVSPRDLSNSSVIDFYDRLIEHESIDLSLFELELTERAILGNRDIVISRFDNLRTNGLKIALDDYGVGYNSLINLVQIPTDYIKIDKTFIDNITDNAYRLVIEHTISSAHQLGRQIVAEGVERKDQLDILNQMGCDYIQGYYYSRPLLPDDLIAFYSKEEYSAQKES